MLTPKYSKQGIRVSSEIPARASNWDLGFIDTFTASEVDPDPFVAQEDARTEAIHSLYLSAIRQLLPQMVLKDDFAIYYLTQIKLLPYGPVAEHFGLQAATARKKVQRVKEKIHELARKLDANQTYYEELDEIAYNVHVECTDVDYEFNFELSEQQYEQNQLEVELALKLK
ncbi:MAG: hypothetical protein ACRC6A_10315 [Fusobacteriaceae bacterium]